MGNLWFIYALSAAVLWGFGYILAEKIMDEKISPPFLFAMMNVVTLPFYFLIASYAGHLKPGWDSLTSNPSLIGLILLLSFAFFLGNLMIFQSIFLKNATLTSIIEMSYPIFTFLFAWLILRDVQLNMVSAFGGFLIFAGIATIYLKS